ncbi:MAG: tRNA (guanosine(37)-N1)-methyltransferase TrmD [Trueperaceae bacterium]|nr:MAG: tRNA (guanosine(37)-N1)-methyltransferase TrmD [Trueperaceae bacterium]
MKYTVYTLFPQLISLWAQEALLGRANEKGVISLDARDLRKFANDKHNRVDDTPYGGGAGMVIRVDVAVRAIEEIRAETPPPDEIILLSPVGEPLSQPMVEELAGKDHLCLIAGRYEGFDARLEAYVSREVSIGDFVLMGGEVAALALIEATARLIPGVLGAADSHHQDSFSTGLLDYPEYTRPTSFDGIAVPEILLSGHHQKIRSWRRKQALQRTLERRPDLLDSAELTDEDRAYLEELRNET